MVKPLLPPMKRSGRPHTPDLGEVLNAIIYMARRDAVDGQDANPHNPAAPAHRAIIAGGARGFYLEDTRPPGTNLIH